MNKRLKLDPLARLQAYHAANPADQQRNKRLYGERPADDAGRIGQRDNVGRGERKEHHDGR